MFEQFLALRVEPCDLRSLWTSVRFRVAANRVYRVIQDI